MAQAQLSISREDVLLQLQQIFPDHDLGFIERAMLVSGIGKNGASSPYLVNRCIDHLVHLKPVKKEKGTCGNTGQLNEVQKQVVVELKEIFPDHSEDIITASVKHPSNYKNGVTSHVLLQTCINDMLEGRTSTGEKTSREGHGNAEVPKTERKYSSSLLPILVYPCPVVDMQLGYRDPLKHFDSDDESELMKVMEDSEKAFPSGKDKYTPSKSPDGWTVKKNDSPYSTDKVSGTQDNKHLNDSQTTGKNNVTHSVGLKSANTVLGTPTEKNNVTHSVGLKSANTVLGTPTAKNNITHSVGLKSANTALETPTAKSNVTHSVGLKSANTALGTPTAKNNVTHSVGLESANTALGIPTGKNNVTHSVGLKSANTALGTPTEKNNVKHSVGLKSLVTIPDTPDKAHKNMNNNNEYVSNRTSYSGTLQGGAIGSACNRSDLSSSSNDKLLSPSSVSRPTPSTSALPDTSTLVDCNKSSLLSSIHSPGTLKTSFQQYRNKLSTSPNTTVEAKESKTWDRQCDIGLADSVTSSSESPNSSVNDSRISDKQHPYMGKYKGVLSNSNNSDKAMKIEMCSSVTQKNSGSVTETRDANEATVEMFNKVESVTKADLSSTVSSTSTLNCNTGVSLHNHADITSIVKSFECRNAKAENSCQIQKQKVFTKDDSLIHEPDIESEHFKNRFQEYRNKLNTSPDTEQSSTGKGKVPPTERPFNAEYTHSIKESRTTPTVSGMETEGTERDTSTTFDNLVNSFQEYRNRLSTSPHETDPFETKKHNVESAMKITGKPNSPAAEYGKFLMKKFCEMRRNSLPLGRESSKYPETGGSGKVNELSQSSNNKDLLPGYFRKSPLRPAIIATSLTGTPTVTSTCKYTQKMSPFSKGNVEVPSTVNRTPYKHMADQTETITKLDDEDTDKIPHSSALRLDCGSVVDPAVKKTFKEYRNHSDKLKKETQVMGMIGNDSSPEDIKVEQSVVIDPSIPSTSTGRGDTHVGFWNDRRRFMLHDLSSDSEPEDDKPHVQDANNSEEEKLPTITFNKRNCHYSLPMSPWKLERHGPEKSRVQGHVPGLRTESTIQSPLEENKDVKQRKAHSLPYKLPNSKYVAAGRPSSSPSHTLPNSKYMTAGRPPSPSSSTFPKYMTAGRPPSPSSSTFPKYMTAGRPPSPSSSTFPTYAGAPGNTARFSKASATVQSGEAEPYQSNKPTTIHIESTCKITYSPQHTDKKEGGDQNEMPNWLTHVPEVSLSFSGARTQHRDRSVRDQDRFDRAVPRYQHTVPINRMQHNSVTGDQAPTLQRSEVSSREVRKPTLLSSQSTGITGAPPSVPVTKDAENADKKDKKVTQGQSIGKGQVVDNERTAVKPLLNTGIDDDIEVLHYEPPVLVVDSPEGSSVLDLNDSDFDDLTMQDAFGDDDLELLGALGEDGRGNAVDLIFDEGTVREVVILDDGNTNETMPNTENGRQPLTHFPMRARRKKHGRKRRMERIEIPADTGPKIKTPQEAKEELMNEVLKLFPEVELTYLEGLCRNQTGMMALNNVCYILLDNQYPRAQKQVEPDKPEEEKPAVDYFKHCQFYTMDEFRQLAYTLQMHSLLPVNFRWISLTDIKSVASIFKSYALTYRALQDVMQQALDLVKKSADDGKIERLNGLSFSATIEKDSASKQLKISLLKKRRSVPQKTPTYIDELDAEIKFVKDRMKELATEEDHQMALQLNEKEYEAEGQGIECGCCFCETPFDNMVQCLDGHLFCEDCLRSYAKESLYGQGKAQLECMTSGCNSAFPKNQLEKALPSDILLKYEDRVAEESLNLADIGDLVRCPRCDYPAIMDPGDRVFTCMNEKCKKETCRHCKEDWSEHFGKKCEELEKKDEVKLRLEYEEKMTKAKVRTCHRCKAQFTKEDGCNKMTCRCGAKMCYICRQPLKDYSHFCQHPREPGKPCSKCEACSLWTNPEEDDNRAVLEIQKEATQVRKDKGFTDDKLIGAPDGPPAKKMRMT